MPGALAGVVQNTDQKPGPVKSLLEGAGHLLSKAWDNRGTIMSIAKTVAPLILADTNEPTGPIAVKVDYLDSLN